MDNFLIPGAGTSDMVTGSSALRLERALVLFASSVHNMYIVAPLSNALSDVPKQWLATSLNGTSLLSGGVYETTAYMPGTTVLVAYQEHTRTYSVQGPSVVCIIGSFPPDSLAPTDTTPWGNSMATEYAFKAGNNALTIAATEQLKQTSVIQDRNGGRLLEALPGDYILNTDTGAVLLMGKLYHLFGGGPMARIEFDGSSNTTKLTGYELHIDTAASHSYHGVEGNETRFLFRDKRSVSILESLGSADYDTAPLKETDEVQKLYGPVNEKQREFFRHNIFEGLLFDGIFDSLVVPNRKEGLTTNEVPKNPTVGTSLQERTYNGSIGEQALHSISSLKTYYVHAVTEFNEQQDSAPPADSSSKEWETELGITPENRAEFSSCLLEKFRDQEQLNTQRRGVAARKDNFKEFTRSEVLAEEGVAKEDAKTLKHPGKKQYCDLPASFTLTDPATGKSKVYYASESLIKQHEDGSVSITDGYGSEIRMVRGNIIITCANDIQLRPGRDKIELTGRNSIINSQSHVQIQSAKSDVRIKAETSLEVLSGNGGTGRLLLQNKGTAKEEDSEDEGVPSGIIMRSVSDTVVQGGNILVGLVSSSDLTETGFADSTSGVIAINASAGTASINAAVTTITATSALATSCVSNGSGSVMGMSVGNIGLYSAKLGLGTGALTINKAPDTVDLPLLKETASVIQVRTGTGTPSVDIAGSLRVAQNAVVSGSLGAGSVSAGRGAFGNATEHYSCAGGSAPAGFTVAEIKSAFEANAAKTSAQLLTKFAATAANAGVINATSFAYPRTTAYGIDDYSFYAGRWQLLAYTTMTDKWSEPSIKHPLLEDTAIFPGAEYWLKGKPALYYGLQEPVALTEYTINKI